MSEQFHYFATHAMGYAIAKSHDEAISDLLLKNTDPTWVRNCLKSGEPMTVFCCRVPLAATAPYKIAWYRPEVDGLTETGNHIVTYLTKKKFAVMADPRDEIVKLTKKNVALQSLVDILQDKDDNTPSAIEVIAEASKR